MKRTSKTRCPECDRGTLEAKSADLTGKSHGESLTIQSDALVCPKCGFKTIPTERMGEFALRIADAWRDKHGLLTSAQIRSRRTDLRMSQRQFADRSEEHTSELQSPDHLVCRLLLEKKNSNTALNNEQL